METLIISDLLNSHENSVGFALHGWLTGALVEEQEIVRDGLFLLDIYSVEGKSESTKACQLNDVYSMNKRWMGEEKK